MRGEHFGYRSDNASLHVVDADRMSDDLFSLLERFRFPVDAFDSEEHRKQEIEIDRSYHHRSTYIFSTAPGDDSSFVAVMRLIGKMNNQEKLPIEYGHVAAAADNPPDCPLILNAGEPFGIADRPDVYPAGEIGGLRAAEPDPDRGITMRVRYTALDSIMKSSAAETKRRGFRIAFVTCLAKYNMQNAYRERYLFNEAGEIVYGTDDRWKALWRWVN